MSFIIPQRAPFSKSLNPSSNALLHTFLKIFSHCFQDWLYQMLFSAYVSLLQRGTLFPAWCCLSQFVLLFVLITLSKKGMCGVRDCCSLPCCLLAASFSSVSRLICPMIVSSAFQCGHKLCYPAVFLFSIHRLDGSHPPFYMHKCTSSSYVFRLEGSMEESQ